MENIRCFGLLHYAILLDFIDVWSTVNANSPQSCFDGRWMHSNANNNTSQLFLTSRRVLTFTIEYAPAKCGIKLLTLASPIYQQVSFDRLKMLRSNFHGVMARGVV